MRKQGNGMENQPLVYSAEIIKKFIHETDVHFKFL
jgi:hypothetical protein